MSIATQLFTIFNAFQGGRDRQCVFFFKRIFKIILFIFFWLCWVFVTVLAFL